jgi:citrate synthase
MPENTLTVTDNRTGKSYELPVEHGTIRAMDLRQIKTEEDDFGLMSYDPAFTNTASTRSTITFLDGEKGILRYRGYPIEQLAESSGFLEVAYLILHGELPDRPQLQTWVEEITLHTFLQNIDLMVPSLRCPSMSMFIIP